MFAGYFARVAGWLQRGNDRSVALLGAALLAFVTSAKYVPRWLEMAHHPPSWQVYDLDAGLIHDGVVAAPRFLDTLQWWVGPWAGTVPFYRPLASYLFWFEWKLFGEREWLYGFPTGLAHVIATVLFAALVHRLSQRWRLRSPGLVAVLAAWIFTGLGLEYREMVVGAVTGLWKNQPDSWAALCCFAALLAYLKAQDAGRRVPWAAGAWYLAACCFKEIAVPLPVAALALELDCRREERGRATSRILLLGGCGVLFLAVRFWALGGLGYRFGSNDGWLQRTVGEVLGPLGVPAFTGQWTGIVCGVYAVAMGALWWRTRPLWQRRRGVFGPVGAAGIGSLLLLVGASAIAHLAPAPGRELLSIDPSLAARFVTGLLIYTQGTYTAEVTVTVLLLVFGSLLWRRSRRTAYFGLIWTATFLAPLTMSPGPVHRYYLTQSGYVILGAVALFLGLSGVADHVMRRFGRPHDPLMGETASVSSGVSAIQ
ncbi:MAG: hypothetical protein K0Q72_453 [Armatimonadetes bacterium]|nr:hypothetical protein [Armatimonadota bacterium]